MEVISLEDATLEDGFGGLYPPHLLLSGHAAVIMPLKWIPYIQSPCIPGHRPALLEDVVPVSF